MNAKRFAKGLIAVTLLLSPALASAESPSSGGVGVYTAVMGKVTVTHPGGSRVLPVKLHDEVLFKDVIQTEKESRTKAFFQDDSVLTVGENSRVEITEYIYDSDAKLRRSVVMVMQGQVRALVSKVFKSNGSRFEVHTPSALAAARGTYFTVWHENGQSGIINIGESGRVDFTSGGVTVAVDPGQFSLAERGMAPSLPAVHGLGLIHTAHYGQAHVTKNDDNEPTLVDRHGEKKGRSQTASVSEGSTSKGLARALLAVEDTNVREARLEESPMQAAEAMHHDVHLTNALATLTSLADSMSGIQSENAYGNNAQQGSGNGSVVGAQQGGSNGSVVGAVVTPPAVLTGAGDDIDDGPDNGYND